MPTTRPWRRARRRRQTAPVDAGARRATRFVGARDPGGPPAEAGAAPPPPAGGAARACDPEIPHRGVLLAEGDVLGFDVARPEPLAVGVAQSVRHFHRDPHRLV